MSTRDFCWEAMIEVTGANPEVERGAINKALKSIRELEPELALDNYLLSAEIHERAKAYRELFPDGAMTPPALAKHWVRVLEQRPKPQTVNAPAAPATYGCICNGDKIVFVGVDEKGHDQTAPCPECNPTAEVGFWRADGTRFHGLEQRDVRVRIQQP